VVPYRSELQTKYQSENQEGLNHRYLELSLTIINPALEIAPCSVLLVRKESQSVSEETAQSASRNPKNKTQFKFCPRNQNISITKINHYFPNYVPKRPKTKNIVPKLSPQKQKTKKLPTQNQTTSKNKPTSPQN
jgi:hypothetical protein